MSDTTTTDTPISKRSDVIEDVSTPDTSEAAQEDSKNVVEENTQQADHDATIVDDFFPNEAGSDKLFNLELDRMTLTTLKFMKKASSQIVEGITPDTIEDVVREIGIYLLAHDQNLDIRERSKIFSMSAGDMEIELDVLMHKIEVKNAQTLLMNIVDRVVEETKTLAVPIPDSDVDGEPDLGNG